MEENFYKKNVKTFALTIIFIIIFTIVLISSIKIIKGYKLLGKEICTCRNEMHSALGGAISMNACTICKDDFTTVGSSKELCNSCAKLTNRCDNCGKLEK